MIKWWHAAAVTQQDIDEFAPENFLELNLWTQAVLEHGLTSDQAAAFVLRRRYLRHKMPPQTYKD